MNAPFRLAAPRREEALAIIIDRIARTGCVPSYEEIGLAMRPPVSNTRVSQLVDQLVSMGVIDRDKAARRGIRIRDLVRCRAMIEDVLGGLGWRHAGPLGALRAPDPCANAQLPVMPAFEHLPDLD